jgi:hypothetical protein
MESIGNTLAIVLALMGTSIFVALLGLLAIARDIRRLRIPPDADYWTTMRYVPFALVVLLDLLDFGLDIFAAPISWIVLDRMGLYGLRNKAAVEALIPFTQPIPTFTLSWIAARTLDLGEPRQIPVNWEQRPSRPPARRRRQRTIIDADDHR